MNLVCVYVAAVRDSLKHRMHNKLHSLPRICAHTYAHTMRDGVGVDGRGLPAGVAALESDSSTCSCSFFTFLAGGFRGGRGTPGCLIFRFLFQ